MVESQASGLFILAVTRIAVFLQQWQDIVGKVDFALCGRGELVLGCGERTWRCDQEDAKTNYRSQLWKVHHVHWMKPGQDDWRLTGTARDHRFEERIQV